MLCDLCGKKTATVHWTEMVDDVVKKMHLCEQCAVKKGLEVSNPATFTDVLLGLGVHKDEPAGQRDLACPVCHMRISDFKKATRVGCQACYDVFMDELAPLLAAMHKGNRHVGKSPKHHKPSPPVVVRQPAAVSLAVLRNKLEAAIAAERYEDAALLRDQIRELEERDAKRRPVVEPE